MLDLVEKAVWTGVQSGIAILSADSFGWLEAANWQVLATAGIATGLSALKTFSQARLQILKAKKEEG